LSELKGKTLGLYTIDERIAIGGMAEIYRAHTNSGEPAAVKVIHPRLAQESKFVQMFLDEAKIVVNLKHPNIVQIYDFGRIENTYYLSMEWIDGKSLSSVIQRQLELNSPFPVEVALVIAIDILKGLHHAHTRTDRFQKELAIVHRDVSPPNILLNREGMSKIADFGIADAEHKVIETRPGIIRGKFSYMSPEQSKGEVVDARSDIFSFGIVLHEMLLGKRLFLRTNDAETIAAVRTGFVPSLVKERNDVSEALERIVRKALYVDRNKRYRTAQEFASALWFELQRFDLGASHKDVARFLKVLFPWETFVGIDEPLKVLLKRFRERGKNRAFVVERIRVKTKELWIHGSFALAALLIAELLAHLYSSW
jgi:serine/threonine-protein kinase